MGECTEMWDVYTRDRVRTGKLHARKDKMPEGEYHLVVSVCIFNSKNQMLLQHRQTYKKGWPNMWDISAAGSALAGENSQEAAERETLEEIGVKLDLSQIRPHFTVNMKSGFNDFYLIEKELDVDQLQLQEEEVQGVKWADLEEILAMQKSGEMVPYWFIDKLFEIRSFYGAHGNEARK